MTHPHPGLYSIFVTDTHTEIIGNIGNIEIFETNDNASIIPIISIISIISINKAMALMINSLRLKRLRPGAGKPPSIAKAGAEEPRTGAGFTGLSSPPEPGGGLDVLSIRRKPYHIDNKSFRRIVKTALTEILTSLNVPKKVKLFKTKELENA